MDIRYFFNWGCIDRKNKLYRIFFPSLQYYIIQSTIHSFNQINTYGLIREVKTNPVGKV